MKGRVEESGGAESGGGGGSGAPVMVTAIAGVVLAVSIGLLFRFGRTTRK